MRCRLKLPATLGECHKCIVESETPRKRARVVWFHSEVPKRQRQSVLWGVRMVVILEGGRGSGQWGWGSRRDSGGLVSRHGPLGKCVELYTYFTCTLLCVNYTSIIKIYSFLNATPRDSDLISLKQGSGIIFCCCCSF